jgi:hypothetical protein
MVPGMLVCRLLQAFLPYAFQTIQGGLTQLIHHAQASLVFVVVVVAKKNPAVGVVVVVFSGDSTP